MRTALTISAAAHLALWIPLVSVGVQPLSAPTTEAIAVEIVSPEVLEPKREAQEPAADDPASAAQVAKPPTPPAPPQPDQNQQMQQASAAQGRTPSAPGAGSAQPENAQPAQAEPAQAEPAQAEPADEPNWSSWLDSPLMTASIGFETVPSAAKLADREVAAFKARLRECWNPAAGLSDNQNLVVVLRVPFEPNGALAGEPTLLAASASANGAALMQTALRALRQCQPFAFLRAAKYKEWKTLDLSFSPAGLSAAPKL